MPGTNTEGRSLNYGNTNRGQIWPNEQKENHTHPDFKGSLNVKGEEFWISAWKQKGAEDPEVPGLSFFVQPKSEGMTGPAKDYVVKTDPQSAAWD